MFGKRKDKGLIEKQEALQAFEVSTFLGLLDNQIVFLELEGINPKDLIEAILDIINVIAKTDQVLIINDEISLTVANGKIHLNKS